MAPRAPSRFFTPPPLPAGVYADSQFAVDDADLRRLIGQRYAGLAKQIGYHTDAGDIEGEVGLEANRQRADIQHSLDQARQDVTNRMQQAGTLFSGYRGDELARAEYPHTQALGNLDVSTGSAMSDLYDQVMGLADEYKTSRDRLLLDAINRRQAGTSVDPGGPNAPADLPPVQTGAPAGDTGMANASTQAGGGEPAAVGALGAAAMPPPNPQIAPQPSAMNLMSAQNQPTASRANPRRAQQQPAPPLNFPDLIHNIMVKHPSGHQVNIKLQPHEPAATKPMGTAARKQAMPGRPASNPTTRGMVGVASAAARRQA